MTQIVIETPMEQNALVGRSTVRGKFLYVGTEKFWVRGISYGTFYVDDNGEERRTEEMVRRDFAQIAASGFNVVRIHTGPPRWFLDLALEHGLRVMVGLNWGEHMAFLDEPGKVREIEDRVRRWIRTCAGHPAVLCYSIGNEIPASIVRWHGRRRVEKFIERLYRIAKDEDPDALVTYVNYPSTEYLRLPFLDFPSFNVYLESPEAFEDYLARLHSLSDDRPVLLEVIVVNDGSTDATPQIASEYRVRLITTRNQGLSAARNIGIRASTGEIVAFIDDDAYPDLHWLRFLALAFRDGTYVAVGGPNLPPPDDGWMADAVANAPGGPNPVLLSDRVAEHIPGCNMAFRKEALEAIGGFDSVFRTAGDDVDVCWRLRDRGGVIGYAPGAVVWHHRRPSIRRFWKQQVGYGKAEALLERKWPARYNPSGQLSWVGRLYGKGRSRDFSSGRGRVYQGVWGTAPFQSLYESRGSRWSAALAPEWYLLIALLSAIFLLTLGWGAALLLGPVLLFALGIPLAQAGISARHARFVGLDRRHRGSLLALRIVVWFLHLMQQMARLPGRLRGGLTPWRRRGAKTRPPFRPLRMTYWRAQPEHPA